MLRRASIYVPKPPKLLITGPTIQVPQLEELLYEDQRLHRKRFPWGGGLRIFDCAYTMGEPANHDRFMKNEKNFGKINKDFHPDVIAERLPGANHFNLDNVSYPGKYERALPYPPEIFEYYVSTQRVKKSDLVVLYGRGDFGGMLFAARVWWMLKTYGMEHVVVLEGGLEKWREAGGVIVEGKSKRWKPRVEEDNRWVRDYFWRWEAADPREDLIVRYDDIPFDRLNEVNMLDCRPEEEFDGRMPFTFSSNGAPGSRLPGSKNVPLSRMITSCGEFKSDEEIRHVLPTYTMSNDGISATVLGLALEKTGFTWSLFNGSLREVSMRNPSLISATG